MPRTTELKSEEAVASSPLRRSCRIVAVNSPHPVKGRRLSATSDNNGADEKNENKPSRAKRAASATKEDIEPKIEPAKPRTRRSSAASEPAVVEEEKREPVTRSRRSSAAEEPSQETLKPVKTRRSSITDDSAKTPAGGKSTEGEVKSKPVTRRRSISKETSDEAEENKPATRSRRRSMDKDVDVEILEKKTTRQRRASTEKQEETETRVTKLTPIKNKRRPSVTDNAVVLEPIEEVETERKSLSPLPVNDTTSKHNADSVKKKPEPSKADLDLSIINECSFTEGNSSHTEEVISTSEMSTGPSKETDEIGSEINRGKYDEENSAAAAVSITPPNELKTEERKSTTPKKSPRFRTNTDSETATDDIVTEAQNNMEDPKLSPELQDDVKKESPSEVIPNKSQTSKKNTPEKVPKPAINIETTESLDKPKQTSPGTTVSPRKSPRILARKENSSGQSEKEVRTLDSNSTMEILKESKTITGITEKIQSPTPDKEKLNSLHQNIVDSKDSDLIGSQKELIVEDDSAFLPQAAESKESQIKVTTTHISSGSEDSFRFHLSNSRLDSSPGEPEEDDVLNVSKISNSSDKENIAVNIDNDSIKAKAELGVEKRVLGDLSVLNEKLIDLQQATTVARVSNVFRPKNLDFSFAEPMDVDKTSVDLESTTIEKLDRIKLLSGATDDSIDESFRLNLSSTPVESPITAKVFDTPKKVIEINEDKLDVSSEKVIPRSNSVEDDEVVVDVSEACCATPSVESEDLSNISISKEPILEVNEESGEQMTNNSNMSTIVEEAVNKPDEQNSSKIAENQSVDEKTIMSPDYEFQLPSDESSSEVDNKFFERPSSPCIDESKASNVEKDNKDLVNADQELEPSDKEICGKPPVEQPEQSSTTIKLIESEVIYDVEKERTEMEETAKTLACSATEKEETIVKTGESEIVINPEPDATSEKPLSLEKSMSEEKDIEQKYERSNVVDEIEIKCTEGEIENILEGDKSTINNIIVERIEIDDSPNVTLENISENENHTKADSEEISNNEKFQIDGQDKKTIDEDEKASETKSDELKTEKTSDSNMVTEVQTGQSSESVKIPLGIKLSTEENDDSPQCSINTIVVNNTGNIVDAESEIVKIDSPTNQDDDYEEMERSFQDIVKDDEVRPEKKPESPMFLPTSEIKKSKKARKSKGESVKNEKLDKQHAAESPQKTKKDNLSLDNSDSSIEDYMSDTAPPSKTTKKAKKNTKNDATTDETGEMVTDTEENALSNVDNASDKELVDQHAFEFELSRDKKKIDGIDTKDVANNSGGTDINIEAKSNEDSFTKTPKKAKKKAKVITLTGDSTESVPTEGPTLDKVESTRKSLERNEKRKSSDMLGSHENDKNVEVAEEPKTKKKKNKKSKLKNSKITNESTHESHLLEGFCVPKLDEIIDKMVLETKRKSERTDEEDSSEKEYASEEEEEETREENPYIYGMAEEGEEDTPSEGSNDIIDDGESINTTESERETDDDYDDADSFICDEEVVDLLSGDDEFDLGDEKIKKKKKSRIINVEGYNSNVIRIERKEKPVEPKARSRIITVSSSSEDEKDESPEEVVQVSEHEASEELKDEESSEKPRKRKSSITIIENINVTDIKDTVLSQRIHHLVDSFCTTIPRQGDISMNLSLEYADKDEEPSIKTNKQKSPRRSLLQTSPKEKKTKKRKDAKKSSSDGETEVSPKKPRLSESLNNFGDLQDAQEANKLKRLSTSLEDVNIKKGKKKKKSAKKIREVEEDSEVSEKKRRYSENDLRTQTFSLLNQLITDVKNRPKRPVKPSTSKVDSSIDDSWDVEVADVMPSTSIVSKKEIEKYKFDKLHPSDFRNQMLYGSKRVKRIETKKLLKKKGAYS